MIKARGVCKRDHTPELGNKLFPWILILRTQVLKYENAFTKRLNLNIATLKLDRPIACPRAKQIGKLRRRTVWWLALISSLGTCFPLCQEVAAGFNIKEKHLIEMVRVYGLLSISCLAGHIKLRSQPNSTGVGLHGLPSPSLGPFGVVSAWGRWRPRVVSA